MIKKKVISPISFADSEFKYFQLSENSNLTIFMNTWQENPFKIIFYDVTQFTYKLGDFPKGLYELTESLFLTEALSKVYIKVPINHPYKHFQIVDINDFPFIEVAAESVIIMKEDIP